MCYDLDANFPPRCSAWHVVGSKFEKQLDQKVSTIIIKFSTDEFMLNGGEEQLEEASC